MPRKPKQFRTRHRERPPKMHKHPEYRQWRKFRKEYLLNYPLCVMCQAKGKKVLATVVDHIRPRTPQSPLICSVDNLRSLCTSCHNKHTRGQQAEGVI